MPLYSLLCIELPRKVSDKLSVETMPTNYDPTEAPKPVEDIITDLLDARKRITCLRGFRDPAIYDCVQLRVQIFRHKLGNHGGKGGCQLGRLEHAGIACRDSSHL